MSNIGISLKQIVQQQSHPSNPPGSSGSIRKFTKTNIQPSPTQNSNSHQHMTEPAINFETDSVIQYVIQQILKKMDHMIQIGDQAGKFAIKLTLSVLIDDPNLGLLDSNQILREHRKCVILNDDEPKASAFIDGSVGHVKIQPLPKKSNHEIDGENKKNNNPKRLSKNGRASRVKYSNINRKSLLALGSNLPPILERKATQNQQSKAFQQLQSLVSKSKFKNNSKNIHSNDKFSSNRFSESSQGQQSSKFVNLGLSKQQYEDDQFINYLRYVKVDSPNENYKLGQVSVSKRNSYSNDVLNKLKQQTSFKQINQKDSNSSENNNVLISPIPLTQIKNQNGSKMKKKAITYQSLVTINQGRSQNNNFGSDNQPNERKSMQFLSGMLSNKQKIKSNNEKKYMKGKNLESLNNENAPSNRSMKKKNEIQSNIKKQKSLNSPRQLIKQSQSCNKQIKLPILSLRRNSRASKTLQSVQCLNKNNLQSEMLKCEQVSVWLKQKQKIKEYDNSLNTFMNLNSLKSSVQIRVASDKDDSRINQLKQSKNNRIEHNRMDSQDMQQRAKKMNEINLKNEQRLQRLQKQHKIKKIKSEKQNNQATTRFSHINKQSGMKKKSKVQKKQASKSMDQQHVIQSQQNDKNI